MSSHYGSSHYGGTHYASSHYGRDGQIVIPIVPGGGIMDAMPAIRKKRGVLQRSIRNLLILSALFISITQEESHERREDD